MNDKAAESLRELSRFLTEQIGGPRSAEVAGVITQPTQVLRFVAARTLELMVEGARHDREQRMMSWLLGIHGASLFGTPTDAAEQIRAAWSDPNKRRYVRDNLNAAMEADDAAFGPLVALMATHTAVPLALRDFRAWCRFLEALDKELVGVGYALAGCLLKLPAGQAPISVRACADRAGAPAIQCTTLAQAKPPTTVRPTSATAPVASVDLAAEFVERLRAASLCPADRVRGMFLEAPSNEAMITLTPQRRREVSRIFVS